MTDVEELTGAELVARRLVDKAVDTIFCITGAGNLALVDAIHSKTSIKLVFSHHEQAAVMEAQGYARVSGKVGVALVTTGGGTSNALTGILSAYLDSVPVLVISGNESSFHCVNMDGFRAYGVQGFDSRTVSAPMTKMSTRILDHTEILARFESAWTAALSGRQGPVLFDFPMDVQRRPTSMLDQISPVESANSSALRGVRWPDEKSADCVRLFRESKRPLLYLGNGVRGKRAQELAQAIIEKLRTPFCLSWSALDLFEDSHPLNMGRIGIYGDRASNIILQKSDFLLCVGTRLAIPQIGYDMDDFARMANRFVVDIDEKELSKFDSPRWSTIHASAETFLEFLDSETSSFEEAKKFDEWVSEAAAIRKRLPRSQQIGPEVSLDEGVHSYQVIEKLNAVLDEDAVVVTDVGAGLLTGHYAIQIRGTQRFFTSQGLGEMGFGLPGSIGAFFASPNRQIVCLNTDGGIMFNLQELQVVKHHEIPLKLVVFNNDGYAMIKISQQNLFSNRTIGSDTKSGISFPSFEDVAKTFGFGHLLVDSPERLMEIDRVLRSPKSELIEIKMSPDQRYLPRLATNRLPDGSLVSPPIEDLDPPLPIHLLAELLGYEPHEHSFRARGIPYG